MSKEIETGNVRSKLFWRSKSSVHVFQIHNFENQKPKIWRSEKRALKY